LVQGPTSMRIPQHQQAVAILMPTFQNSNFVLGPTQ
jgi:hypothetical protein